ncbi:HU family DNA-binding protein [Parabacteroides sp.]
MNNRLTIQDLAALLAEYTGKDKNSTERFLREFIAVVSKGVYTDKLVKVKGLGTFKIIPVEKRESIHVNTGERFVIPEHYKFSFLPDKELRELVNRPFSFFETTELGENVDFTDMDVVPGEPEEKEVEDESVEEVMPEEKPQPQEEAILDEPEISETVEEIPEVPEDASEETSEEIPEEISKETYDKIMEGVPETLGILGFSTETPEASEIQKAPEVSQPGYSMKDDQIAGSSETNVGVDMSRNKLKLIIWVVVIFLACFGICLSLNIFFFSKEDKEMLALKKKVAVWKNDTVAGDSASLTEDTVVMTEDVGLSMQDTLPLSEDPVPLKAEEPVTAARADTPDTSTKPKTASPKVIARVKIEPGSRLTLISLKYYGSKLFWVYLYEYNKAIIKDPNNVPIGTVIEVPAPEMYGIDRRDRSSVEKAAARQTEILSGKQ